MALVLGVTAARMAAGEMLKVLGSMSVKTGVALQKRMGVALPIKVKGVVMTSVPGAMLWANRARWMAVVPLEQAIACFTPI